MACAMKSTYGIIVVLAAALLFGGAERPRNHGGEIVSAVQAAQQGLKTCITAAYNDSELAPLTPHMPMSVRGVTAEQRSDNSLVTDQEAALLTAYGARTKVCRTDYLRQMIAVLPSIATLMAGAYDQNEASLGDLIQKRQSWGAYVKRVETTYTALSPTLSAELQRIGDELDRENPAE
jgi:hypothetical protein